MQPLWVFSGREQPPPSLCPSAQALPQPRCCPGSPLVEDGSLWIKYRPHPPTPLQARLLRAVSLLQSLEVEGGGGSMCEGMRQEELGMSGEKKIRPGEEGHTGLSWTEPCIL